MFAQSTTGGGSQPELAAWDGFLRAHADLVGRLDADLSREHGLTLSSYDVLSRLAAAPDRCLRMSELASSVLLTPSGLTRLIDRLCRDGLVRRRRCRSDARGSFAVLTDRGLDVLGDARRTYVAGVRKLFLSRLSAADLRRMASCWDRVTATAD
jgi:DNA-binding MarR family transcriptional regulator